MYKSILIVVVSSVLGNLAVAEDIHPGKIVFDAWCAHCHGDNNAWSGGGTASLQRKYNGQIPAKLEDRTGLTADFIKLFVRNGIKSMPQFRLTEISHKDMDALVDYLVNN